MTSQPTLPPAPRDHDLPPRWDGHPVEWRPWQPGYTTTYEWHAKQPTVCGHCASTSKPSTAHGVVYAPETGLIQFRPRGGYPHHLGQAKAAAHARGAPVRWLTAFRCPDCRTDRIHDQTTNELWDLDDSDYTNEGSYAR